MRLMEMETVLGALMRARVRSFSVPAAPRVLRSYWLLTKPKITRLVLFCTAIGMLLAAPQLPPLWLAAGALLGIGLLAASAFAVNSVIERHLDARMARTRQRPIPRGEIGPQQAFVFSGACAALGMWILAAYVNSLTMWLSLATFFGYAVVYTVLLKPRTPQNIVIGGLSGAMPPVLGWSAITGSAPAEAWVLALIIFVWTPPHFWSLALYRIDDYRNAGVPMLPLTHGSELTRLHILLYTVALAATGTLPFAIGMSGLPYLAASTALSLVFVAYAWRLWRAYSDRLARATFSYSIAYLAALFSALLIDQYLR
jgi:protoheme IX farnesyltransferase